MTAPTVGVLALQGAFAAHRAAFHDVGVSVREVRRVSDLDGLRALMIPGGESTTLLNLIDNRGALAEWASFSDQSPMH